MATFGEMIYMCLDFLKETSGDAFYTEDHILFLIKKMRAYLLDKKYKGSRNSSFTLMSEENKQRVCLKTEPAPNLSIGCSGKWLRSVESVPDMMEFENATTCTFNDMLPCNVSFIPKERMRYVGYSKWLKNIIYAAKSVDGHIYLHSDNPQFIFLEKVGITGVFSDPEEVINLREGSECTDIMNEKFPLEEALISQCVELVVQELSGARFMPRDNKNDSRDNLPETPLARAVQQGRTRTNGNEE